MLRVEAQEGLTFERLLLLSPSVAVVQAEVARACQGEIRMRYSTAKTSPLEQPVQSEERGELLEQQMQTEPLPPSRPRW